MHPTLKLVDLVKDGQMVRFFWTDEPQREVGIHSYSKSGETICSESLTRDDARHRWSQMIRAGWKRDRSADEDLMIANAMRQIT